LQPSASEAGGSRVRRPIIAVGPRDLGTTGLVCPGSAGPRFIGPDGRLNFGTPGRRFRGPSGRRFSGASDRMFSGSRELRGLLIIPDAMVCDLRDIRNREELARAGEWSLSVTTNQNVKRISLSRYSRQSRPMTAMPSPCNPRPVGASSRGSVGRFDCHRSQDQLGPGSRSPSNDRSNLTVEKFREPKVEVELDPKWGLPPGQGGSSGRNSARTEGLPYRS
jgi:hypothetical protein